MNYTWPEQQAGVGTNVGLCFPGGGTRAMSAAMGQLRAIIDQNLIQSIDYISCISGGSWLAAPFAYYNTGACSDVDFLGRITDPDDITGASLDALLPDCVGWGATQSFDDALWAAYKAGVPNDLLWIDAVGQLFFARYGLYDRDAPAYFSLDAATVEVIQNLNPSLANQTFNTVRQPDNYKVPYLLVNATIEGPTSPGDYVSDPLVMVTYTPLYVGVPFQQTVTYIEQGTGPIQPIVQAMIGGGFIEPFAWGSSAPDAPPSGGTVTVASLSVPFGIASASGTSSSAFAESFEKSPTLDVLLPEAYYWPPVASGSQPSTQLFDFGDGGNLDNYGLIPLLMRGVQNIILFVNSEYPLSTSFTPSTSGASSSEVDPNLPPFFRVPVPQSDGGNPATAKNAVFPAEDYVTLIGELQAMKKAGQPMIQPMTHQVLANGTWGLPGGGTVNVLWIYLDQVDTWKQQLPDWLQIELDVGEIGPYPYFPNYKTVDEDGFGKLTVLTVRQVNLLADLTCWVVRSNASTFRDFIQGTSSS
jgi:hypothetical protein